MGGSSSTPKPPPPPPPPPPSLESKLDDASNKYKKWRDTHWKLFVKYQTQKDPNWYKKKQEQYITNFTNLYQGLVNQKKLLNNSDKEIIKYQNLALSLYENIHKEYKEKMTDLMISLNNSTSDIDTLNRDIAYDMQSIDMYSKTEKNIAYLTLGLCGCIIFLLFFKLMFIKGLQSKPFSIAVSLIAAFLLTLLLRKIVLFIEPSIYNISKLRLPTGNIEKIRINT